MTNPLNHKTYLDLHAIMIRKMRNTIILISLCLGLGIIPAVAQTPQEEEKEEEFPKSETKALETLTQSQIDSIKLREANMAHLKKISALKGNNTDIPQPKKDSSDSISTNVTRLKKESKAEIGANSPMYQTIEKVDTMDYRIDRNFTKEQLNALVFDINKKHTAILSYSDIEFNNDDEIVALKLKLIDSRLRESTYRVVPGTYMTPIRIYEYPDGRSGIKPIKTNSAEEPIPAEVLERMAAQEFAAKQRELLRIQRQNNPLTPRSSTKQPKIIVRSSTTVPKALLTKEQQKLRPNNLDE